MSSIQDLKITLNILTSVLKTSFFYFHLLDLKFSNELLYFKGNVTGTEEIDLYHRYD